jgi:hypothetical protein
MSELIPLNTRVALREGADDVYLLALPGTEGWVRDHKQDPDGFEMVAVEWDKDHWRYNGQPDGWTFADHFKVIGPPSIRRKEVDMSEEFEELPKQGPSDDQIEEYVEQMSQALDAASEAEGFFMLSIKRVPNPNNPGEVMYLPQVFTQSITPEAEVLLDVQLVECANLISQQMALSMLEKIKNDSNK